jgi:site-specific recombinase XerD
LFVTWSNKRVIKYNQQTKKLVMSVKLRRRQNADGSTSQYLDIYHEGQRSYEFLKNLQLTKGSGPLDREKNRENRAAAEKIAIKRAQELVKGTYGVSVRDGRKTQVVGWLEDFCKKYKKRDIRVLEGTTAEFKQFLADTKRVGLTFGGLNEKVVTGFRDHLQANHKGEGPGTYYNRFKKMIKAAYRDRLMPENPCEFVAPPKGQAREKEILTLNEVKTLASTHTDSDQVKRAFLFTIFTGLRFCDIKALTWDQVKNNTLRVRQNKTGRDVVVNLNKSAQKQLPEASEGPVFSLPSANACNKTLQAWVTRAGINKKISWHSGRHSFGTLLVFEGTDLITTGALLGHTSLRHTQRYVRTSQQLKESATQKLDVL